MAPPDDENFGLLSDEPAYETDRGDELMFRPAAEVLVGAALQAKTSPITIGVFGDWGTGKTSLMRLMHRVVGEWGVGERAAVPVWFNAWQYEREEHLIVPLIATIARDIEKREAQWKKIEADDTADEVVKKIAIQALDIMKSGGKKVHDALRAVLYGISVSGKAKIPFAGEIEIAASMKDAIDRYEAVTQDTLISRSLYFDAFDKLRALARDEKDLRKPQIVVFVDDLDRCFPEQAVRLLESVKLVLHQPGFAFVLGIYPQIVEEFIRNKYAAQYAQGALARANKEERDRMTRYLAYFDNYLDKIVQVRHYVPSRPPERMRAYLRRLLADEARVLQEFVRDGIAETELFDLIAEVGGRNPRGIVRKINSAIVKWRIHVREREQESKENEVREGDGAKGGDAKFALLAALINDMFSDLLAHNPKTWTDFLDNLASTAYEKDTSPNPKTLGQCLAEAFAAEKAQEAKNHTDRIRALREAAQSQNPDVFNTINGLLIEPLKEKEREYFCNALKTRAGRDWLSSEEYRKESRQVFQEAREEAPEAEGPREPEKEEGPKGARARDVEAKGFRDLEGKVPRDRDPIVRELEASLVPIPAGEFRMGSPDGEEGRYSDEGPQHEVSVGAFKMGRYPVTQAQYEAVMGKNPSHFKEGDDAPHRPVEQVSWNDAMVFCERLTQLSGDPNVRYTLPTEAQWEYACRAGSTTRFCFGDSDTDLGDYAWYAANSENQTHPVGGKDDKKPNAWDLRHMHGNVFEWCLDHWHDNYTDAPRDGSARTTDNADAPRVLRGGSWLLVPLLCRSAFRSWFDPTGRDDYVGFRVVGVGRTQR